jgi:hypothetical protein
MDPAMNALYPAQQAIEELEISWLRREQEEGEFRGEILSSPFSF